MSPRRILCLSELMILISNAVSHLRPNPCFVRQVIKLLNYWKLVCITEINPTIKLGLWRDSGFHSNTTFQIVILNYDNCPLLIISEVNNSDGSEIWFLFPTSWNKQVVNLVEYARLQSVINTIYVQQRTSVQNLSHLWSKYNWQARLNIL